MFPFITNNPSKDTNTQGNDTDDVISSSEAIQGDEALITTINELNELRNFEDQLTKFA